MKSVIILVVGVLIGATAAFVVVAKAMPNQMITVADSNADFETTVATIETNAVAIGWKVPKVYNMQKSLADAGFEIDRVTVFSICSPKHAYAILSADSRKMVSAMMPCRIAVFETEDGAVKIAQMNVGLMSKMFGGVIEETMGLVSVEQEKILSELVSK